MTARPSVASSGSPAASEAAAAAELLGGGYRGALEMITIVFACPPSDPSSLANAPGRKREDAIAGQKRMGRLATELETTTRKQVSIWQRKAASAGVLTDEMRAHSWRDGIMLRLMTAMTCCGPVVHLKRPCLGTLGRPFWPLTNRPGGAVCKWVGCAMLDFGRRTSRVSWRIVTISSPAGAIGRGRSRRHLLMKTIHRPSCRHRGCCRAPRRPYRNIQIVASSVIVSCALHSIGRRHRRRRRRCKPPAARFLYSATFSGTLWCYGRLGSFWLGAPSIRCAQLLMSRFREKLAVHARE